MIGGKRKDVVMVDLVLGSSRDLIGSIRGLSSFGDHVGTRGLTAELDVALAIVL